MPEKYEAHIFRWWMHHQLNDPPKEEAVVTSQFDFACDRHRISSRQGRTIVNYYIRRFRYTYDKVFDMGHRADVSILDLHFSHRERSGGSPFRLKVLLRMKVLHDDHSFKDVVARKLDRKPGKLARQAIDEQKPVVPADDDYSDLFDDLLRRREL